MPYQKQKKKFDLHGPTWDTFIKKNFLVTIKKFLLNYKNCFYIYKENFFSSIKKFSCNYKKRILGTTQKSFPHFFIYVFVSLGIV